MASSRRGGHNSHAQRASFHSHGEGVLPAAVPPVAAPETSGDWTGLVDFCLKARSTQTLVIWEKYDDIFLSKFRVFLVVLKDSPKGDRTRSFRT
jgi:hypothetical protein